VDASGHEGATQRRRVTVSYEAQYLDPIAVGAGEPITVTDRVDHWQGREDWVWVWCTDLRGKSGWVPAGLIAREDAATGPAGRAREDYVAVELGVTAGEEVIVRRSESGWLWCTNRLGQCGWVPADHVEAG
jgi:hypothetical protein